MSGVNVAFKITKEAAKLIKAGKAVLSSGGVRDLTGKFIELVNPTAVSRFTVSLPSLNPVTAGISIASSLACNVQCGFIQHGVNTANAKLNDVLLKLDSISQALGGLQTIQALSWVNTAFSLANSGISVAGFYMTLTKINKISDQLQHFYDEYKQDRQHDKVQHFNEILENLKSDLGTLKNRTLNDTYTEDDFRSADPSITRMINEAKAFIEAIIDDFENDAIDGQIACQIIFTLAAVLSQTINEFCSQYYYVHHVHHHMYEEWISFLDKIDCDPFREALKRHLKLNLAYAHISPVQKASAFLLAFEGITQQKNRLATCATLIDTINEQEYYHIGDTLNEQLCLELPKYFP